MSGESWAPKAPNPGGEMGGEIFTSEQRPADVSAYKCAGGDDADTSSGCSAPARGEQQRFLTAQMSSKVVL